MIILIWKKQIFRLVYYTLPVLLMLALSIPFLRLHNILMHVIVDTQLPPKLADFMASEGIDATHTTHYPQGSLMPDNEIRRIALRENRIIVTKDKDFFEAFIIQGHPPRVLLLQLGNISTPDLLSYISRNILYLKALFERDAAMVICQRDSIMTY